MKTDAIAREILGRRTSSLGAVTFTQTMQEVELVKRLHGYVQDVEEFHRKFGIAYEGKPRVLDFQLLQFRLKFMREELNEYEKHADAAAFELDKLTRAPVFQVGSNAYGPVAVRHHLAGMVDALVDLVYVALGTAHLHGFDFDTAWDKVHAANMAKERPEGEARNAEERIKLKMIKPLGWSPPDHANEVRDNAHDPFPDEEAPDPDVLLGSDKTNATPRKL